MSKREKPVDAKLRRRFQDSLLTWYAANKRALPWRNTADPYRILVSEIMLQQTQVDRVIPKYGEFLKNILPSKRSPRLRSTRYDRPGTR
jgi:A/G-specific adenine glycosylase